MRLISVGKDVAAVNNFMAEELASFSSITLPLITCRAKKVSGGLKLEAHLIVSDVLVMVEHNLSTTITVINSRTTIRRLGQHRPYSSRTFPRHKLRDFPLSIMIILVDSEEALAGLPPSINPLVFYTAEQE